MRVKTTNNTETVEYVCEAIIKTTKKKLPEYGYDTTILQRMKSYMSRILEAHKREIAEKDAEIKKLNDLYSENERLTKHSTELFEVFKRLFDVFLEAEGRRLAEMYRHGLSQECVDLIKKINGKG